MAEKIPGTSKQAAPAPAPAAAVAIEEGANQKLAAQIAELVCSQGLISAAKKADFQKDLAAGRLKAADWTVLIEQALPPKPAAGGAHA